jgi:hypothetical protein
VSNTLALLCLEIPYSIGVPVPYSSYGIITILAYLHQPYYTFLRFLVPYFDVIIRRYRNSCLEKPQKLLLELL